MPNGPWTELDNKEPFMPDNKIGYIDDAANWLRGFCMGAADIVPGVSGGTVALILGHYERLIAAIASIDMQCVRLVLSGRFGAAAAHCDLRFLIGLGVGIASGILGLASLMHYLLVHHQSYIYALFAGMILASSYLVANRLTKWTLTRALMVVVGVLVAWQICILNPMQGNLNPLTAAVAASIAICAMILPGISGAFVLLLLGLYHPITELLRSLPKGQVSVEGLTILACFVGGCALGLLSFSRLLRWLLCKQHDPTMAFLVGLMIGSLYKIWPFQEVTPETVDLPFKQQQFVPIMPGDSSSSLIIVLAAVAAGAGLTILMEILGQQFTSSSPDPESTD
jgi:putative membrane protein